MQANGRSGQLRRAARGCLLGHNANRPNSAPPASEGLVRASFLIAAVVVLVLGLFGLVLRILTPSGLVALALLAFGLAAFGVGTSVEPG